MKGYVFGRSVALALILGVVGCTGQPDDQEDEDETEVAGQVEDENLGTAEQALSACSSSPSTTNCDNVDPVSAGCDADAVTIQTGSWAWGESLDQRYSAKCKSRWTRYTISYINTVSTVAITRVSPSKKLTWEHNGMLNYTNMIYCPRTTCGATSQVSFTDISSGVITTHSLPTKY